MNNHLILLGDSIIDNNPYVRGTDLPVEKHLKKMLPDWSIEKRAIDGSVIEDVINLQLGDLKKGSPIALSAGGNNLLKTSGVIQDDTKMTFNQVMKTLKPVIESFEKDYEKLLNRIHSPALCFTIYNPAFHHYDDTNFMSPYQEACEVTVNIFNDIIQRLVLKKGFDVLELRALFTEKNDYANSIEPSHQGGEKIAKFISHWLS